MRHKITAHIRGNVVGYIALFATLGGTSFAAVGLEPGSVRTATFENAAVTRLELARKKGERPKAPTTTTTTAVDGSVSPTDPPVAVGTDSIGARARFTSSVVAPHGGSTDIPLTGNSWTQAAEELQLLAGTVVISNPGSCTGGFGNALTLSVDGNATTFAAAPFAFKASTLTVPFVIGTLSEPSEDTEHELTAKFANSCTKEGEDYTIEDVKVDVLKFR